MRVEQFPYLSTEAKALRRRDGTPPWGCHPCEVDSLAGTIGDRGSAFAMAWREASRLRRALEDNT